MADHEEPVVQRLDAHLTRLVALCDELGGGWASFLEHAKTADKLFKVVQAEAAADRMKASELIRLTQRVLEVNEAVKEMVKACQQSWVGTALG